MASEIDPTVIQDNQKVDKSDLREQLTVAKNEITELQNVASPARQIAFSDASFDNL